MDGFSNQGHLAKQWRISGNWEPKMFLLRRGDGMSTDVEALWADIHSDAAIERMKRLGINTSHIHFHKGYGLEFESGSIQEAKQWSRKLHDNGIAVGAYIGSSFFTETFRHRDVEEMVMQNGYTGWSAAQYFRKYWCYNSPKAIAYFKEVIRTAIQELGADILHMDNSFSFYHDYLCHCKYCLEGFGKFVAERPWMSRAAGYADAGLLSAPPLGNGAFLRNLKQAAEPGDAAWILYHAHAGYEAMKGLIEYARGLRRDVCILYNGATLCGITSFSRPNQEMAMMDIADSTVTEDDNENWVHISPDGITVSRFRPYKAAARKKKRALYYTCVNGRNNRLMLAEAAAFGYRSLGIIETPMQKNHELREQSDIEMFDYLIRHEHLFIKRELWHSIAVLRHHESMLLNPFPSGLTPYVVEQMLFEGHEAFSIIDEHDLAKGIGEFDVLILPDCKCLNDEEIRKIEQFVHDGGAILAIGNTGDARELNGYRNTWGLGTIFGRKTTPHKRLQGYQETADSASSVAVNGGTDLSIAATYGQGRAIYIGQLDFDLPDKSTLNLFGGFDWYYHPYWKKPKNADIFTAALQKLTHDRRRVETDLPTSVGVEYYTIQNGWRVCFVNFGTPEKVTDARLKLRLEHKQADTFEMRWQSPGESRRVEFADKNGMLELALPELDVIGILDITKAAK